MNSIGVVVSLLTEIKNQDSGKRAVEATGILCLIDKDFARMLYFITDILTVTKRFSDFLQSENLDLAAASDMSLFVMEELQEKREGGNAFEELERNAAKCCANWKIPATENKRRKKLPQWLKNYVVTEKGIATEQPESSFRTDIFLPILDCSSLNAGLIVRPALLYQVYSL